MPETPDRVAAIQARQRAENPYGDPIERRHATVVELVAYVTPRVVASCRAMVDDALCRTGLTIEQWRAMGFDEREAALRGARKARRRRGAA